MANSLPPKINSPREGRLDLIFLRPAIYPKLLSSQNMLFSFTWWGCEEFQKLKLAPYDDEVKIVYDICCDSSSFYRYLKDVEKLEVTISVGENNEQLDPSSKRKFQKKQWKEGEIIGHFTLSELKFSPRGEYAVEEDIYSARHKLCGSVVAFMLYTSDHVRIDTQLICSDSEAKKEGSDFNNGLNSNDTSKCDAVESKISTSNVITPLNESKVHGHSSSTCGSGLSTSSLIPNSMKLNSQNSSKQTRTQFESSGTNHSAYFTALNEIFPASNHSTNVREHIHPVDISTTSNEDYSASDILILKKLFSCLDSGAIQMSDLPSMYQIYQGRSPSLDLSNLSVNKAASSFFSSESMNLENPKGKYTSDDRYLKSNKHGQLNSTPDKSEHRARVSTSELSGSKISAMTPTKKGNPSQSSIGKKNFSELPEVRLKKYIKEASNDPNANKCEESSLIILWISNMDLNSQVISRSKSKKMTGKVRQRSKFCYLLEVLIVDNDCSAETAIFVSRQENKGIIHFDCKKIFRLTDTLNEDHLKGHLHFRLIRRKLGERLGEELGVCISSMQDLYELRDQGAVLPLWTQVSKEFSAKLSFSISFALCQRKNEITSGIIDSDVAKQPKEQSLLKTPDGPNVDYRSQSPKIFSNNKSVHSDVISPENENKELFSEEFIKQVNSLNVLNCLTSRSNIDQRTRLSSTELELVSEFNDNNSKFPQNTPPIRDQLNESSLVKNISEVNSNRRSVESSCSNRRKPSSSRLRRQLNFTDVSDDKENRSVHNCSCPKNESNIEISEDHLVTKDDSLEKKCLVHLEILEGNDFPLLTHESSTEPIAPSCYVQVLLPSEHVQTPVVRNCTQPEWLFKTAIELRQEDTKKNDDQLILVVFHCMDQPAVEDDPVLGFAILDIKFIWTSFVSLCGWIPVHSRDGHPCGSLKISLTPVNAKENSSEPLGVCQQTQTGASLRDNQMSLGGSQTNYQRDVIVSNIGSPKNFTDSDRYQLLNTMNEIQEAHSTHDSSLCSCKDEESSYKGVDSNTFVVSREDSINSDNHLKVSLDSLTVTDRDIHSIQTAMKSAQPHPYMNPVLESHMWMNKERIEDSPCVSYLETFAPTADVLYSKPKSSFTSKKKKASRIAANFSLPFL